MSVEIDHKNISSQQFADQVSRHREQLNIAIESVLPPEIVHVVEDARSETRRALRLSEDDIVVIFGEQTYGLNEPPKVLGKRLIAKDLQNRHGVKPIELFASYDMVGTEGGIYRMQLPCPNAPEGHRSINVLAGWSKRKHAATAGFRSPTRDELQRLFATMDSFYGSKRAIGLKDYLDYHYSRGLNYADANIDILRSFESQIGLQIENYVREEMLDTKVAQNGGMQVMLHIWPRLSEEANNHNNHNEVRVPNGNEVPFQLYHTENPNCMGRMISSFMQEEGQVANMDTPVHARCMECKHEEFTTPRDVTTERRQLTWKAIPRVVLYSTLLADGHITGGGSVYNQAARGGLEELGIPYFPITWMDKHEASGNKRGIFKYESSAIPAGRGVHELEARTFVLEGRAAMTDLVLSVGVEQLRESIEQTLGEKLTTSSRVICPEPVAKAHKRVINILKQ